LQQDFARSRCVSLVRPVIDSGRIQVLAGRTPGVAGGGARPTKSRSVLAARSAPGAMLRPGGAGNSRARSCEASAARRPSAPALPRASPHDPRPG